MKILYLNYLWNDDRGDAIQLRQIAKSLQDLGHDIDVCFQRPRMLNSNEYTDRGAPKKPFRRKLAKYLYEPRELFWNLRYLISEHQIISKKPPDVILGRIEHCIFSCSLSAWMKKIPIVLLADGLPTYEAKLLNNYWHIPVIPEFVEKKVMELSDAVITISNEAKRYLTEVVGIAPNEIFVVPNGVDIDAFKIKSEGDFDELQIPRSGNVTIGFVGSFYRTHDIQALKILITEISKKRKDVSFLLVGDGEKRDSLVGYLRESHHLDRVVFSGHVDHDLVPHYISAMDIALAPFPKMDFWYASPMKVLEYMACCRPVVATNQGQVREIIEDGKNGFLCAPGNYREMLARVERLIDNADLRRELGENARKTVCKEYTWKNSGKKILKVMETVLKRHAN